MKSTKGFTLIEVMIVIAILAIVVAIALPSYRDQVRKSRRADAVALVMNIAQRMERCFTIDGAYSAGGTCPTGTIASDGGYYQGTVAITSTTAFAATIVPVAGKDQANDAACASFVISQTGAKTATNSSAADNTAACWAK